MNDFNTVKKAFISAVICEIGYRDLKITPQDVLEDIMESCICIIGNGRINTPEYEFYSSGADRIRGHLFETGLNRNKIAYSACELLYLCACICRDTDHCDNTMKASGIIPAIGNTKVSKAVSYIRKADKTAGLYLKEAVSLLGDDFERLQKHAQDRPLELYSLSDRK